MSRIKRIYFDKASYHVSIRGNNRQSILECEEDKIAFLATVCKYKNRYAFKLYGLIVMDNHAHLLIETNARHNISKIMQAITLSYSQKFRNKYKYTGYVWQGRFKSSVISDEKYLIGCLDYIHNNPVRAGLVKEAKDYPWSSFHSYNGGKSLLAGVIEVDVFKD